MTKIKLHFSQKTMTKTKSYFAVKMNTAAWAYCTGDGRLQDVERPAGTQPPTPALATSQGAHHLSSTNLSMVNLPTPRPLPTPHRSSVWGGKWCNFHHPFPVQYSKKSWEKRRMVTQPGTVLSAEHSRMQQSSQTSRQMSHERQHLIYMRVYSLTVCHLDIQSGA